MQGLKPKRWRIDPVRGGGPVRGGAPLPRGGSILWASMGSAPTPAVFTHIHKIRSSMVKKNGPSTNSNRRARCKRCVRENSDRKRSAEPTTDQPIGNPPTYLSKDEKKIWKELTKQSLPGVLG